MTQYELELRYAVWRAAGADPASAGRVGDWVLPLGPDRLLFNPMLERWFYHDAVHGEWVDCGIVAGEAVFVSIGGVLGARRVLSEDEVALPLGRRIELVASRQVGVLDGQLVGPLDAAQLQAIAVQPGSSLYVWSTRLPCWTPV